MITHRRIVAVLACFVAGCATPADSAAEASAVPVTPSATSAVPATQPAAWAAREAIVIQQQHTPFAEALGVTIVHPMTHVLLIGYHESNHEGARQLTPLATSAPMRTLESRGRLAGSRSAADIVGRPDTAVVAPVTGTVVRAGTYRLYCDNFDDFVVIAPDAAPNLEVKLLHIDGVAVQPGDAVVAGQTVLAPRLTVLPFASQVDAFTPEPSWPHVHLEVVDPSIENISNGGSGPNC